jgi:type I restriction enzyme S subunit
MKNGWPVRALGDVCNIIGGGTPSKANKTFWNGDIIGQAFAI